MMIEIKAIIVAILTAISVWLGVLTFPLCILFIVIVIDYITGLSAAGTAHEVTSEKGWNGVKKKLFYFVAVGLGGVLDWLFNIGLSQVGIEFKLTYLIALLITFWLIVNEIISILENLVKIGVPIPPFLNKIVEKLRVAIEKKGDVNV